MITTYATYVRVYLVPRDVMCSLSAADDDHEARLDR